MSTTKNFQAYKGMPTPVKARATGKWDYRNVLVYTTENQNISVNMSNYDGLSMNYEKSYQSGDKVDFSNTVLPWKWDYSTSLSTSRYCLMPIGTTYNNITTLGYDYNFNVIGSPTINNDTMVVSNFSTSNYLQLQTPFNPGNDIWEIVFKVKTPETLSTVEIYGNYGGSFQNSPQVGITSGNVWSMYIPANPIIQGFLASGTGTYVIQPNTFYWVKLYYTGTHYKLDYSLDGTNYTNDISVAETGTMGVGSQGFNIGFNNWSSSATSYWTGSIDLSESYIKVNGTDLWIPSITETYKQKTNYNNVGSVSVDSDYIASSFSSSKYLTLNKLFNPASNVWSFQIRVKTPSSASRRNLILGSIDGWYNAGISLEFNTSQHFGVGFSSNGSSWDLGWITGSSVLSLDTWYYVKFSFDGSQYKLESSTDGSSWTTEGTVTSSTVLYTTSSVLQLGTANSYSDYYTGSIDLKNTFIDINGDRFWSAVETVTESLPGCTYNFTDDGSATTLNAFVVNNDDSVVLTPDNSYTNGYLLGTVSIPAHSIYSYNNGVWTDITPTTLHKYDRVDGKATVADFWTDGNGQRYAVCVADAQYRSGEKYWSNETVDTLLPNYTSSAAVLAAGKSGTYNTDTILNNYTPTDYPAFNVARNALTITVDNKTFESCLPNAAELQMIYDDKATLDTYDITLTEYPNNSLSAWNIGGYCTACWTSNERGDYYAFRLHSDSSLRDVYKSYSNVGVIPIIEIPVDANGIVL